MFDEMGDISVSSWNSSSLSIICYLSSKCANFKLHSLSSLTFPSSILFSRENEKWDNYANKAFFFTFIVLVWVLHFETSIIQHSKEVF